MNLIVEALLEDAGQILLGVLISFEMGIFFGASVGIPIFMLFVFVYLSRMISIA